MFQLLLIIIYISFISLGLPDGLLGAAWPTMYPEFHIPVSYAGIISIIISFGTITTSFLSDKMTRAFGTGKLTAISVAATAAALFGFSISNSFFQLCLWSIPYGLGAGSVDASLSFREILRIPGVKEVLTAFYCYCALEQTAGLWASSYLNLHKGIPATTAAGFILIGLGCAPVYPCLIHSTPAYFGADKSQAIIGIQMAFAYIGILIMPPIYGLIANHISASLLPVYLLIILILMVLMYEKLEYRSQNNRYNE